jgi:uncharacterized protein (DUF2235 family)
MTANQYPAPAPAGPRNLVVCLDGTNNEPETGVTNAARLFDVAAKGPQQLVYYNPGVGTLGAQAAITPWAQALTRLAGMVAGYGIKDNIAEAYTWLAHQYQPGDRIYVFGFSRGAYTARALTGMLRTVGLLHADADNLVPYALKLYAKSGGTVPDPAVQPDENTKKAEKQFWKVRNDFRLRFGNPAFPNPFDTSRKQVRFLGVWDTVKFVGWLNVKARLEIARWPFTNNVANVDIARHALAIDERRRPFAPQRLKPQAVADSQGRLQERWFGGVHGDIGGQDSADDKLPDIAFSWIAHEALNAGLKIDAERYRRLLGVNPGDDLPVDRALGVITPNVKWWVLAGGWRTRSILPDDTIDPSVRYRIEQSRAWPKPYRPSNVPDPMSAPAGDQ